MIRAFLFLSLLVAGGSACVARAPATGPAAPPPIVQVSSADPLPPLTGRVVDRADILGAEAEAALTERLAALEKETSDQLVVVTVDSLGGEPIEKLGLRLGNGWGVGQEGLANGVLLIVAPADRRARIEVGRGLEGLLTDERAQNIMDEKVVPACRKGRCERAIADAVAAIAKLLRSDPKRPRPKREAT